MFTVLMTEFDYILLQDVLVRFSDWHFANGYSGLIQTLKCPLSYQIWTLTVEIFYDSMTVSEQSSVNVFVNQTRKSKHAFFKFLDIWKKIFIFFNFEGIWHEFFIPIFFVSSLTLQLFFKERKYLLYFIHHNPLWRVYR